MNNQITKSECEAIIDRLADKTLSFGCRVGKDGVIVDTTLEVCISTERKSNQFRTIDEGCSCCRRSHQFEVVGRGIIGHPVFIGQIFAKMKRPVLKDKNGDPYAMNPNASKMIALWERCGFTKSLNQILEEAQFTKVSDLQKEYLINENEKKEYMFDTPASNLFLFLKELGL